MLSSELFPYRSLDSIYHLSQTAINQYFSKFSAKHVLLGEEAFFGVETVLGKEVAANLIFEGFKSKTG